MAWGLPKLPGFTFPDPTRTAFQACNSLKLHQGYRFPDTVVVGSGGSPTDVDSNAFALPEDSVNYDPSLTYGRVKQAALPQVLPHFVHYDKRCLNFKAYFQQPVYDSPDEAYRVRIVNIIYFLEDDTMTVMEPQVRNSGIWQGRIVNRGKIPKNDMGECWHWKDLNVAKDICIYGRVFHTVSCDLFTKEWLESQGIELAPEETIPEDSYVRKEKWKQVRPPPKPKTMGDPLRRFLEYDGKVLCFDVVWDNRDMPFGELEKMKLLYFLQDDKIAIKELPDPRGGKDPFPMLLKKTKLPKNYKVKPVDFPSVALEVTEAEVTEYYAPCDLIIGETIFVMGRRMLLCDCDNFSRMYYKTMLNIEQPPRVDIPTEKRKQPQRTYPPHIGIGTPEDSLGSCFGLVPKPPHKDIVRYNLNANKYLRYLCKLTWIHPEDRGRRFVLSYSLADGTVKIGEIPRRNSGIREGQFLKSMKLQLPDSDPNFPTYFTPEKFFIGAVIPVFKHRFEIIGCDLYVYRYMSANPDKFPREVIDNVRNYHMREGNLKDELQDACREEQAEELRSQIASIGQSAVAEPDNMEKCLKALHVVEGEAAPIRPPTPPMTSDVISYDDTVRAIRRSKPDCEGVTPLKGILKSGLPKDDQQKVVCFTGAAVDERGGAPQQKKFVTYQPGQQPHFDDSEDFCDKYREPDEAERAARRARGDCPYEVVPSATSKLLDEEDGKVKQPGMLHRYDVDCKQIPDHMRLARDAYQNVKPLRQEIPEISPAAERRMHLPREPVKNARECLDEDQHKHAPELVGKTKVCPTFKREDVAFGCPRTDPPVIPCDDNYKDFTT